MTTHQVRFSATSRVLHWLMAVMVLAMLFIGVGMAASVSERYALLVSIHKPLGIAILVLVVIRFVNRLVNRPPPLPATIPYMQRLAAKASHILLYALMFLMPLGHEAVLGDLRDHVELLRHHGSDTLSRGQVDEGAHLGAKDAEFHRPGK